jgi:hypothetical protein
MRRAEDLRRQARDAEWIARQTSLIAEREELREQARRLHAAADLAEREEARRGAAIRASSASDST